MGGLLGCEAGWTETRAFGVKKMGLRSRLVRLIELEAMNDKVEPIMTVYTTTARPKRYAGMLTGSSVRGMTRFREKKTSLIRDKMV